MGNRKRNTSCTTISLAISLALGGAAAGAAQPDATATMRSSEPLQLEAQPGWLNDGAADDEGLASAPKLAADENRAAATSTDRATIAAVARRALAERGLGDAKALARDAADVRVHATAQGAYIAQFPQRVAGIEVFGARTSVLLDRSLTVRAVTGGVAPAAAVADAAARPFQRDPANALRSAAGAVDGLLAAGGLHEVARNQPPYQYFALGGSPTFVPGRPARIKPVWYPTAQGLLPAYYAEISGRQPGVERPVARAVIVSADDGRTLSSTDLIRDHQPFAYRLFATPQGLPYNDPYGFTVPHPTGQPNGWRPTVLAPMNLVSLVNAGISTGDPWLPDGATETVGNNVDAFFDASPVNAQGRCDYEEEIGVYKPADGDLRAVLTGSHAFDYAYDANDTLNDFLQCPAGQNALPIPTTSAQLNAKTVQMFYAGNWLHDYFYNLGFDEQAGNLQQDNYGRGGIGGDPLIMLSGGAHPFTMLADEGESEVISMGISRYSLSRRDTAAFDFAILAHEWTHAVQARTSQLLTYSPQGGAIGEGSGDFIGLMLTLRGQDRHVYPGQPPFSGAYPLGAYTNLDYDVSYDTFPPAGSPGHPDNTYYHGARRFPYSTDMAVNPLTFRNIGVDHPLPASLPAFDWLARSLSEAEVHTAGEVWTAAMWECARNILVAQPASRFEETRLRFLGDVVAGFKLFPPEPTFTEARDAILYAVRADSEADYRRCRAGFAKRGLGAGAVAPERASIDFTGVVESFDDRERALSIVGTHLVEVSGGDGDGVLDRGELGRLDVVLRNSGFSPLDKIRVKVQAAPGSYAFLDGRQVSDVVLAAGATTTVSIPIRVVSTQGAVELLLSVAAQDQRRPIAHAQTDASFRVNYDLVRDRFVDDASQAPTFAADWSSASSFGEYSCFITSCGLQWKRTGDLGEQAYQIRDERHLGYDTVLEGAEFLVSTDTALRVSIRHNYHFDRAPNDPLSAYYGVWYGASSGALEISLDGEDWESIDDYLVSGPARFEGVSSGWRNDTLDFGMALAGRHVKLRWHASVLPTFTAAPAYWAISRIEISGAAEPMFSRVVADAH